MVYLEALIMEVRANKDFKIGVEGGSGTYNDETGTLFGGFSGNANEPYGGNPGDERQPGGAKRPGSPWACCRRASRSADYLPQPGGGGQRLQNDDDVNVIATPQILTTDNKKATIKVGENVLNSRNTTDGQQDYTNYEYKDVATTLAITPQINRPTWSGLEINVEGSSADRN